MLSQYETAPRCIFHRSGCFEIVPSKSNGKIEPVNVFLTSDGPRLKITKASNDIVSNTDTYLVASPQVLSPNSVLQNLGLLKGGSSSSGVLLDLHTRAITLIESQNFNQLILYYKEKNSSQKILLQTCGSIPKRERDQVIDELICHIRASVYQVFPFLPVEIVEWVEFSDSYISDPEKLNLDVLYFCVNPSMRLATAMSKLYPNTSFDKSPHLGACGGLLEAYESMCNFHCLTPRSEVGWFCRNEWNALPFDVLLKDRIFDFAHFSDFKSKELVPIIECLGYNRWFNQIVVRNVKLNSDALSALLAMLRRNRYVEKLKFCQISLPSGFGVLLAESLGLESNFKSSRLIQLEIDGVSIDDKASGKLTSSILTRLPRGLNCLKLNKCLQSKKSMAAFIAQINKANPESSSEVSLRNRLGCLDLSNNQIGSDLVVGLSEFLGQKGNFFNQLSLLNLSNCNITNLELIFSGLLSGCASSIEHLDISDNRFGAFDQQQMHTQQSETAISRFLKTCRKLSHFDVSNTQIPHIYLKECLNALNLNQSIINIHLNLGGNNFHVDEAYTIGKFVQTNRSCTSLDLSDNTFDGGDEGISYLLNGLEGNPVITSLNLARVLHESSLVSSGKVFASSTGQEYQFGKKVSSKSSLDKINKSSEKLNLSASLLSMKSLKCLNLADNKLRNSLVEFLINLYKSRWAYKRNSASEPFNKLPINFLDISGNSLTDSANGLVADLIGFIDGEIKIDDNGFGLVSWRMFLSAAFNNPKLTNLPLSKTELSRLKKSEASLPYHTSSAFGLNNYNAPSVFMSPPRTVAAGYLDHNQFIGTMPPDNMSSFELKLRLSNILNVNRMLKQQNALKMEQLSATETSAQAKASDAAASSSEYIANLLPNVSSIMKSRLANDLRSLFPGQHLSLQNSINRLLHAQRLLLLYHPRNTQTSSNSSPETAQSVSTADLQSEIVNELIGKISLFFKEMDGLPGFLWLVVESMLKPSTQLPEQPASGDNQQPINNRQETVKLWIGRIKRIIKAQPDGVILMNKLKENALEMIAQFDLVDLLNFGESESGAPFPTFNNLAHFLSSNPNTSLNAKDALQLSLFSCAEYLSDRLKLRLLEVVLELIADLESEAAELLLIHMPSVSSPESISFSESHFNPKSTTHHPTKTRPKPPSGRRPPSKIIASAASVPIIEPESPIQEKVAATSQSNINSESSKEATKEPVSVEGSEQISETCDKSAEHLDVNNNVRAMNDQRVSEVASSWSTQKRLPETPETVTGLFLTADANSDDGENFPSRELDKPFQTNDDKYNSEENMSTQKAPKNQETAVKPEQTATQPCPRLSKSEDSLKNPGKKISQLFSGSRDSVKTRKQSSKTGASEAKSQERKSTGNLSISSDSHQPQQLDKDEPPTVGAVKLFHGQGSDEMLALSEAFMKRQKEQTNPSKETNNSEDLGASEHADDKTITNSTKPKKQPSFSPSKSPQLNSPKLKKRGPIQSQYLDGTGDFEQKAEIYWKWCVDWLADLEDFSGWELMEDEEADNNDDGDASTDKSREKKKNATKGQLLIERVTDGYSLPALVEALLAAEASTAISPKSNNSTDEDNGDKKSGPSNPETQRRKPVSKLTGKRRPLFPAHKLDNFNILLNRYLAINNPNLSTASGGHSHAHPHQQPTAEDLLRGDRKKIMILFNHLMKRFPHQHSHESS